MSKEAIIIQSFNDVKQQYEYSVKGYDVTESVKILLKRHKEEYDKEKNVFAGIQGFIEAQQLYENDLVDLEAKLAESETKRKSLEEKVKFITEEKEANFVDGQKYNELKEQLEKSEKSKESYRLQNEQHHLQLLQFYSRLGVEAFGADIHEKALETLMIMKEQLAEKEKEIESLKHVKVTIGTMETNQVDISSTTYIDQDKISFAVEKLEQVKETAECVLDNALKNSSLNESYYDRLLDEIDNQINELKEMK